MVTEKEIARINELAKKQKEGTLTAEEKEEQQRIEKAGGHVHKNSISGILGVSRAFGDISYKESYYNMS